MRSPGVIYRRYRSLRKKLLYDKIAEAKKKTHANCFYGKTLSYVDPQGVGHLTRVCLYGVYHQQDVDVCSCPAECNAFARRLGLGGVILELEDELKDSATKQRLYPDLVALEWVLDKSLTSARKRPNFIGKLLVFCIIILENALKRVSGPQKVLMEPKKE